jgi:RimJ/RimL family protein N-acetyltransferase
MNHRSLFEGKAVHLTALDPEKDAASVARWTASPEFINHNFDGIFKLYTVHEVKKLLKEKLKKADEAHDNYYFAVRENVGEKMVGLLRFGWILPSHQTAWLMLHLEEEEAFTAYSEEVLQLAMQYAFMELSLHRLGVGIPANNVEEISLFERAGFLRETQRRQAVFYGGKYYDFLGYAILRPEWKRLHQEVES